MFLQQFKMWFVTVVQKQTKKTHKKYKKIKIGMGTSSSAVLQIL